MREREEQAGEVIEVRRARAEMAAADLDHESWAEARPVLISHYWSGEEATPGRRAEARLLWSGEALYARFVCEQAEPLVVSASPQTRHKTLGLWDRDVCEVFIAPLDDEPERYFEFEAAPTGEWLDLVIRQTPDGRETDWDFHSGMTVAARVGESQITVAMRIPWEGLGRIPRPGDQWRGNLFRCIGADPTRGYLAWRPTLTEEPSFHAPEAFGPIEFTE